MRANDEVVFKVEIGRRKMSEKEVRHLAAGQIINLNVNAGSPLAIYADGKLIGHGEAVVVGNHYGVRIMELVSPDEWWFLHRLYSCFRA